MEIVLNLQVGLDSIDILTILRVPIYKQKTKTKEKQKDLRKLWEVSTMPLS